MPLLLRSSNSFSSFSSSFLLHLFLLLFLFQIEDDRDRADEEREIEEERKRQEEEASRPKPPPLPLASTSAPGNAPVSQASAPPAPSQQQQAQQQQQQGTATISGTGSARRGKSAEVAAVFDADEDGTSNKRTKLVPLRATDEEMRAQGLDPEEERKRRQRDIVASIPADRSGLFAHPVAWDQVDASLLNDRIRPWVSKKVAEAFGSEDNTLVSFICEKIKERTAPV